MNAHKGKVIEKSKKYKVLQCNTCGFIHVQPIPSKKQLDKIYSNEYYSSEKPSYIKDNLEDLKWWHSVYKDRLETIEKLIGKKQNKKLLELGSGPGLFLKYAKSNGWKVVGIEPSKQPFQFSNKNKVNVINDFYENISPKSLGKFDAIVMFEFLEHIPDPKSVLNFAKQVLKKNGIICVGVPNDYNPLQQVAKRGLKLKTYWLAPPFHLNYFTIESLTKLLKQNGFNPAYTETSFPLELFLLMEEDYISNNVIGRKIHNKRKQVDIILTKENNDLKRNFYKSIAELNIGRDITIYAIKK